MAFSADTPIQEMLLRESDQSGLTAKAKKLVKTDLIFMGSNMSTPNTLELDMQDISSIKRAFSHDRHAHEEQSFGSSDGTSCCCTPCCCATAVVKPISKVA